MKNKIKILVIFLIFSIGIFIAGNLSSDVVSFTANVNITGDASVREMTVDFNAVVAHLNVYMDTNILTGQADMITEYNKLNATEKAAVLKYFKMLVAESYNDATGASLTWDQVPNSLFTR
jgi:hypothetical protein